MTAPVATLWSRIPQDLCETLLPPGNYHVGLVGEKRFRWFQRPTWLLAFVVTSGPHSGISLPMWLRIPEDERIRAAHRMAAAWVVGTGRRAPRDLARRRPSSFLGDCEFVARVRTVSKDVHGVERPEEASYSRVEFLIRRTAGCPPALQRLSGGTSESSSESRCKSESQSQSGAHGRKIDG
jgi:hypothetical protein